MMLKKWLTILCLLLPALGIADVKDAGFEGQAVGVEKSAFLKAHAQAKLLAADKPVAGAAEYLYLPQKMVLRKMKVQSIMRGFHNERGCGLGIGFEPVHQAQLANALKVLEPSTKSALVEHPYPTGGGVRFFEDQTSHSSITYTPVSEGAKYSLVYARVLKSCDAAYARRWQVLPSK